MDSLKLNTAVGAACVAGLVFLFGKWGAETLTTRGELHAEGHGEETVEQAYAVAVEGGGEAGAGEAASNPAVFLAAADAANGEKVFGKCKACHSIEEGKNGTGPTLHAVFGRLSGTLAGFSYSQAMIDHNTVWDGESLFEFLGDVKGVVPGTKMSFPGIPNEQDRADVIAYLGGSDFDAAAFAAAAAEAEGATDEAAAGEAPAADAAAAGIVAEVAALTGDAAAGEKVFGKCKACHSVEIGKNGTGPSLHGVIGRQAGTLEGFKYSQAMIDYGKVWDQSSIATFLHDVKGTVPGTKMSYPGLKSAQDIADVFAFLETQK